MKTYDSFKVTPSGGYEYSVDSNSKNFKQIAKTPQDNQIKNGLFKSNLSGSGNSFEKQFVNEITPGSNGNVETVKLDTFHKKTSITASNQNSNLQFFENKQPFDEVHQSSQSKYFTFDGNSVLNSNIPMSPARGKNDVQKIIEYAKQQIGRDNYNKVQKIIKG